MTDSTTITTANAIAIETEDFWRIYKTGTQEVAALRGIIIAHSATQFHRIERPFGQRKNYFAQLPGRARPPHARQSEYLWRGYLHLQRPGHDALAARAGRVCLPVVWPAADALGV